MFQSSDSDSAARYHPQYVGTAGQAAAANTVALSRNILVAPVGYNVTALTTHQDQLSSSCGCDGLWQDCSFSPGLMLRQVGVM
jgi:hypothetical protein